MKRLFGIGCLLPGLLFCFSGQADESHLVVTAILSRDAVPYREVLQGVRQVLESGSRKIELDVHIFDAESDNASIKVAVSKNPPHALLSLGSQATEFAVTELKQFALCAGLIVDEGILDDAENATALVLRFPLETEIQWLKKFIGPGKTIALLYNEEKSGDSLHKAQEIARQEGLKLYVQAVRSHSDLSEVLKRLPQETGALWSFADSGILNSQTAKHVLLYSFRNRVPLVGLSSQWTKAGALYSLDRDYLDIGIQCGEKLVQILNGTPLAEIPVEPPRKVLYTINRKTQRHMKLELPERLIQDAHEVF